MGHLQLPDRNRSIGLYPEKSDTWLNTVDSHLLLAEVFIQSSGPSSENKGLPCQLRKLILAAILPIQKTSYLWTWKTNFKKLVGQEQFWGKSLKGSKTLVCAKLKGVKNDLTRVMWRTVPGPFTPVLLCSEQYTGSPVAGKVLKMHPGYLMWMALESEVVSSCNKPTGGVLVLSGLTQLSWVMEWVLPVCVKSFRNKPFSWALPSCKVMFCIGKKHWGVKIGC